MAVGVDEDKLMKLMALSVIEVDNNAFWRFDELKAITDKQKTKAYFERVEGVKIISLKVAVKIDCL